MADSEVPSRDSRPGTQDGQEMRRRDEKLWHEDGNIVLVARNVEFRVYRGVLSKHSSVFADMFSLPQPSSPRTATTTAVDPVEQCPEVVLGDSPEDLRYVLRALLPAPHDT